MKMLMVVYAGASPQRVASLLDGHHAGGYTEFRTTMPAPAMKPIMEVAVK